MSFGVSAGHDSTSSTMDQLVSQLFGQKTNTTQTQTGTTTGGTSGSTSKVLSPYQQAVQPQLFQIIQALSKNPQQFLAPQQGRARNQVNEDYAGTPDALREQFLSGGGGEGSGKYGKAVLSSDLARRGKLADVDSSFAGQAAQLPLTAAQLAQQFLGLNFGETNNGTTEATSTGGAAGTVDTTGSSSSSTTGNESGSKTSVAAKVGL